MTTPQHLPGLPVAVPRPGAPPPVDETPPGLFDGGVDDEAFDWRVTAAVFAFLWAAFTSLLMSVAPPTWGGLVAWFIATAALGGEVLRQRHLWLRHQQGLLAPTTTTTTTTATPLPTTTTTASASLQAGEEIAAAGDVDRVEEGLDKDPA